MNDNNGRPTSQGSSGRRNPGWGTDDPGRDQGSGGPSAGDQGPGGSGGTGDRGTGGRRTGGRGFGGRGSGGFGNFGSRGSGFGGFGTWRPGRGGSGGFPIGLPGLFIGFALFAFLFGAFASCGPSSGPGQVAGQIKALNAERAVSTLAGAQVILRGGSNTYTTVSTDTPEGAEGTDAYNYRFDNVPPGRYTMAVTPPPGSGLQPEADITLEVEADELFPQSVMLLAEGVQKPRPLSPSELNPGEVGYLNERGERVVYQQGSGFGLDDALLMYLLFRNPPGFGYGAPPIIYSQPRGGPSYRYDTPPSRTSTGGRVTSRPPSVPGQGSTRPSSSGATGAGPTYRSGDGDDSPSNTARPPSSSSGSATSPNGTTSSPANRPSQGVTRPSSSTSSPSRSTAPSSSRSSGSSGSRSSGGGRR